MSYFFKVWSGFINISKTLLRTLMCSWRSESLSLTYSHRHTPDICAKHRRLTWSILRQFWKKKKKLPFGDQKRSLALRQKQTNCLQRGLKDGVIKAMRNLRMKTIPRNSETLVLVFVHISNEPCKYFPMCNSDFKYYFTTSNVMHSLNAVLFCFSIAWRK